MDEHIENFFGKGLKLASSIIVDGITVVDIKILSMMKRHDNSYAFLEHFTYPTLSILIGKFLP